MYRQLRHNAAERQFFSWLHGARQPEPIGVNIHQTLPRGPFLKVANEEDHRSSWKCKPYMPSLGRCTEGWGFEWARFSPSLSHLIHLSLPFIMRSVNEQRLSRSSKCWRSWLGEQFLVLIAELCQLQQSCVVWSVCKVSWHAIRLLIHDLPQLIHNFKSHVHFY